MMNIKDIKIKNEKIILVSLSYIIGFTAAFIAFGLQKETIVIPEQSVSVSKTSAIVKAPNKSEQKNSPAIVTEVLDADALYAVVNGSVKVISVPSTYGEGPGFHYLIENYNIISDGKEVRFCSYASAEQDVCTTYIYNAARHSIRVE